MKKTLLALTLSLVSTLLIGNSAISFADRVSNRIDNGKIKNGRMLIPIRDVSEHFHSKVIWNQVKGSITITRGERELLLRVNSRIAFINNNAISLDMPVRIDNYGTTYVPVRLFAEAFGGTALWSQQERKTIITIGLEQINIHTEPLKPWRMNQERINVLNKKINEATDLTSYSQIREHFKPYFTDTFINKIIRSRGIQNNAILTKTASISYESTTSGRMHQSAYFDTNSIQIELINRYVFYIFVDNQWKVNDVNVGRQIIDP